MLLQIQFGKRKLLSVDIQEGDFVLVDLAKFTPEWPQVGTVLELLEENVRVLWYSQHSNSSWREHKERQGRHLIRTEDIVSRNAIYHYGFKLTKNGLLPKKVNQIAMDYDNSM